MRSSRLVPNAQLKVHKLRMTTVNQNMMNACFGS